MRKKPIKVKFKTILSVSSRQLGAPKTSFLALEDPKLSARTNLVGLATRLPHVSNGMIRLGYSHGINCVPRLFSLATIFRFIQTDQWRRYEEARKGRETPLGILTSTPGWTPSLIKKPRTYWYFGRFFPAMSHPQMAFIWISGLERSRWTNSSSICVLEWRFDGLSLTDWVK